jgi:predicted alpha/beta hydrolase
MTAKTFTFLAADGTPLAGALYPPSGPAMGGTPSVLVAGGLGVHQRFYAAFATWLAAQGYQVMTFDVRGMGSSRQPQHQHSLRGVQADMLTWARQDFAAAVAHLSAQNGDAPIALLGHSLGVHHAGMTDAATQSKIAKVVSVAAGSGYWRDWAAPSRRVAPLMLHLAGPLLTPLMGYFPGKRLGMVGDLPGPAAGQWMRWCRHPEFAWGCEPALVLPSLQTARFPIHAFSFTDDEAMTRTCTATLLAAMPNAPSQLQVIKPEDVGLKRIGHIGAFKAGAAEGLWRLLANALRA